MTDRLSQVLHLRPVVGCGCPDWYSAFYLAPVLQLSEPLFVRAVHSIPELVMLLLSVAHQSLLTLRVCAVLVCILELELWASCSCLWFSYFPIQHVLGDESIFQPVNMAEAVKPLLLDECQDAWQVYLGKDFSIFFFVLP